MVMVSIDGFRHDYTEIFNAPNIRRFADEGVRAESLIPSYPSVTFPNQYTLVTGMYPGNHGIVANDFTDPARGDRYYLRDPSAILDGSWYGGTPLWVAAEQQGMLSASYFWVGSEADIQGVRPTYLEKYNQSVPNRERVETVLDWLSLPEAERPHMITLYFSLVDSAGHDSGTSSADLREAVRAIDSEIGFLVDGLEDLPIDVNVIIVSDHGMVDQDPEKVIYLDDYVSLRGAQVVGFGPRSSIYVEDAERGAEIYEGLEANEADYLVYRREDTPDRWHNRNSRLGDILIEAALPWSISLRVVDIEFNGGTHGYDPYANEEMHAVFFAKGPDLVASHVIPSFENIHVYPLVMEILGLEITDDIDGRLEVLEGILRK